MLLIDDDQDFGHFFVDALASKGLECQVLNEPGRILDYDLSLLDHIVIDLLMPDLDGLQILRILKDANYSGRITLISGRDKSLLESAREICQLHQLNFHSILKKPFDLSSLDALIHSDIQEFVKITPLISTELSDKKLTEELADAIEKKTLEVYFQPKIQLADYEVKGFEALARWCLAGVFIPPVRFIALAESTGLIRPLTELIVDKSLQGFSSFKGHSNDLSLSINFSALELDQGDLPDLLHRKTEEYAIATENIILEITETVLLEKNILSLEVLTRLRLMGFKLSIDDFGAGYSSVNMLQNGPFTELKIDRAFVSSVGCSEQSRIIVQSIVAMAQRLNMDVVAEGVEDQATVKELIETNCLIGQGYWFGRPIPREDVNTWLKEWRITRNNISDN